MPKCLANIIIVCPALPRAQMLGGAPYLCMQCTASNISPLMCYQAPSRNHPQKSSANVCHVKLHAPALNTAWQPAEILRIVTGATSAPALRTRVAFIFAHKHYRLASHRSGGRTTYSTAYVLNRKYEMVFQHASEGGVTAKASETCCY